MAFSICIKIGEKNTIAGEFAGAGPAKDKKPHAGEIEVLSWNWGIAHSASQSGGPGASLGAPDVRDLTFMKYMDKATPNLLYYCFKGTAFDKAVLTISRWSGDDAPVESLVLTLSGTVFISSVRSGDPLPNDMYSETVTLNFNKANVKYTPLKPDHTGDSPVTQDIVIT